MLARSTVQGMQEPPLVGRVRSIVPTSFLCRNEINSNFKDAESGDEEAGKKNEKTTFVICDVCNLGTSIVCIRVLRSNQVFHYDSWKEKDYQPLFGF